MSEIKIGYTNKLIIARKELQGLYLRGEDAFEQVLLPNAYVPDEYEIGDEIEVFVYLDNEQRIIATTLKPKIKRDEFAALQVEEVNRVGAFCDMGIVKQLLVPYREQTTEMEVGKQYLVYLYLDSKTKRLVGTTKVGRYLDNDNIPLERGDEVDIIAWYPSELGMNVIINESVKGLIFKSDLSQNLKIGEKTKGYIKQISPDGKVDVLLQPEGVASLEPNAEKLLALLKKNEGFLPLHDKSDPELIKSKVQMSKKSFKKAVGNLYRSKKITLSEEGISLI